MENCEIIDIDSYSEDSEQLVEMIKNDDIDDCKPEIKKQEALAVKKSKRLVKEQRKIEESQQECSFSDQKISDFEQDDESSVYHKNCKVIDEDLTLCLAQNVKSLSSPDPNINETYLNLDNMSRIADELNVNHQTAARNIVFNWLKARL